MLRAQAQAEGRSPVEVACDALGLYRLVHARRIATGAAEIVLRSRDGALFRLTPHG